MSKTGHVPEPERIKAFRLWLAKQIPRFPNNAASLQVLQAKPLTPLLVDCLNWRIRYVEPRPRAVVVEASATSDPRWQSKSSDIDALLLKVEQGHDLTPYLSPRVHTRGFSPAASATGPDADRWADKDMLLNVMGYHHFHLDAVPHNKKRSDDVLFAHVTPDRFTVVGIFDHTVFDYTGPITAERMRLWKIFGAHATGHASAGPVVLSMINTSGHSMHLRQLAMDYARAIETIDPKLDDPNYVRWLYEHKGFPVSARPKLCWDLQYLELGLFDEGTRTFFHLPMRHRSPSRPKR